MVFLFQTIFVRPLYNILVWLGTVLPGENLGLAIIILTLGVRLALFPLQHRMMRTQRAIKTLEPAMRRIREAHRDNQSEQARRLMELYRQHGINPFSGFLLLLIQIPILLALFFVFRDSFSLDPSLLYAFWPNPSPLEPRLFGLIDLSGRSYVLAVLAGLTQWGQLVLAQPPLGASAQPSPAELVSQRMMKSMRYFLPLMIVFAAVSLPSAIALYWLTSSLFSVAHDGWLRRRSLNPKTGP